MLALPAGVRAAPVVEHHPLPRSHQPGPPPPGQVWPVNAGAYGALEVRVVPPLWATVTVSGVELGTTRQHRPISLPAGRYQVVLSSPLVQDFEILAEVRPGEVASYSQIELEPLPVRLSLGPEVGDGCQVLLDGVPQGTAASLGRRLQVDHPELEHRVDVRCRDKSWTRTLEAPIQPESLW